jgi:hypothetical protein
MNMMSYVNYVLKKLFSQKITICVNDTHLIIRYEDQFSRTIPYSELERVEVNPKGTAKIKFILKTGEELEYVNTDKTQLHSIQEDVSEKLYHQPKASTEKEVNTSKTILI